MKPKGTICTAAGFTLVEVLVTAVIVAVLATVSVQIYQGYVVEAKQSMVEHVAASGVGFLQTAITMSVPVPVDDPPVARITTPLTGTEAWTYQMPGGTPVSFVCPAGVTITIDATAEEIQAEYDGVISSQISYSMKQQ